MWTYEAYERVIESAVELPPLADGRTSEGGSVEPDLRVFRADLPATPAGVDAPLTRVYENPDGALTAYRAGETVFWFAEGVGTLRIEGSGRIVASALPAADDGALADLVVGPGLRTSFRLQGDVVVHASAVAVDGRAVAFLGPSGRGKSTTAAAHIAADHDVLADDAVAIRSGGDGGFEVPPGVPNLDADGSARAALDLPGDGPVVTSDRVPDGSRPLAALYLLGDGDEFAIEPVSPRRATFALMRAADGLYADDDAAALAAHQEAAASVVEAVPVRRLVRPRVLDRLSELPTVVAGDIGSVVAEDLATGEERRSTPQ